MKPVTTELRTSATINEVLRELRVQVKLYETEKKKGPTSAWSKDNCQSAIDALQFAIRFIMRHRITTETLQRVLEEQARRNGAIRHYRKKY